MLFAGGQPTGPNNANTNKLYVTIASTGNAQDFGDLTQGATNGKRTFVWGTKFYEMYLQVVKMEVEMQIMP